MKKKSSLFHSDWRLQVHRCSNLPYILYPKWRVRPGDLSPVFCKNRGYRIRSRHHPGYVHNLLSKELLFPLLLPVPDGYAASLCLYRPVHGYRKLPPIFCCRPVKQRHSRDLRLLSGEYLAEQYFPLPVSAGWWQIKRWYSSIHDPPDWSGAGSVPANGRHMHSCLYCL